MKKLPENHTDAFEIAKATAHFENCWKHCLHRECKKRRRCTGGPRGTMRKTGGISFCRIDGNCETPVAILPEPDVPWGEEPPKSIV